METLITYSESKVENEMDVQIKSKEFSFDTPNPFSYLIQEVENFVSLQENWDGYKSVPVLPEIGEIAKNLFRILDARDIENVSDIFPNPNGTISVEWENNLKEKLSLEIGESNYSYFIKRQNEPPTFVNGKDIFGDIKTITAILDSLFGSKAPSLIQ